jgi:hypothetical protein
MAQGPTDGPSRIVTTRARSGWHEDGMPGRLPIVTASRAYPGSCMSMVRVRRPKATRWPKHPITGFRATAPRRRGGRVVPGLVVAHDQDSHDAQPVGQGQAGVAV